MLQCWRIVALHCSYSPIVHPTISAKSHFLDGSLHPFLFLIVIFSLLALALVNLCTFWDPTYNRITRILESLVDGYQDFYGTVIALSWPWSSMNETIVHPETGGKCLHCWNLRILLVSTSFPKLDSFSLSISWKRSKWHKNEWHWDLLQVNKWNKILCK